VRCPRCVTETLEERIQDGVLVDVCRQCRGTWLDRGEFERLIACAAGDPARIEPQRQGVDFSDDDAVCSIHGSDLSFADRPRRRRRWFEDNFD
jgi:Zn-finger nucleic acid-binding protein